MWRRDYREKLEQYPDLTLAKLGFAVPHCDACHLGGRQSTVAGWLKGIPYDELSFEVSLLSIIAVSSMPIIVIAYNRRL